MWQQKSACANIKGNGRIPGMVRIRGREKSGKEVLGIAHSQLKSERAHLKIMKYHHFYLKPIKSSPFQKKRKNVKLINIIDVKLLFSVFRF